MNLISSKSVGSRRSRAALSVAAASTDRRLRAAQLALIVIVPILALYRLEEAPPPWFDEGSYLHVPKNLALHGVYADSSSEGWRYSGPVIGVGPTVLVPVALALKLFGVGLLQARLVMVAFLLLAIWLFYRLARRLLPAPGAVLATTLLITSPALEFLLLGRQVLGEVPAFALLALGLAAWHRSYEPRDLPGLALAGLAFGLALVTKNQLGLLLMPALGLFALFDWRWYRRGCWTRRLLPVVVAIGCYAAWMLALVALIGPAGAARDLGEVRQATAGSLLVFDTEARERALKALLTPKLYGGLLLPAVLYGIWLARRRSSNVLLVLLVLLVACGSLWFTTASIGWPRYAFFIRGLGAILVAHMLLDGMNRLKQHRLRARAGAALLLAGLVASAAVTALPFLRPDNSPQRAAAYLDRNVPASALIETWEPELGFLSDRRFHYPPNILLDSAVRQTWFDNSAPFDYRADDQATFLVIGPFAAWTGIYERELTIRAYELEAAIGPYQIYRRH